MLEGTLGGGGGDGGGGGGVGGISVDSRHEIDGMVGAVAVGNGALLVAGQEHLLVLYDDFDKNGWYVDSVLVPAPHVSSVAFAGDDLRTLVITTATSELDAAQLAAYPDSGRLFTSRVDVPGLPTNVWSGPHT